MAFAQLTFRESLRDIETCLRAHSTKLYHLGIRGHIARSTLADANETRDWRIYRDFALSLIHMARKLYADDSFAVELAHTAYALDTTTIDLSLSLFPWARFRKTKAAVKLHTLLDLRGNIPAFIHISDGKLHEVNVLDQIAFEPGSFYMMDRGFLDFGSSEPIESTLQGEFRGFGQGRRYVLQNGQEWEQIDATHYSGGRKEAPNVSMRPGVMGAWYMKVDGVNVQPKVRRTK